MERIRLKLKPEKTEKRKPGRPRTRPLPVPERRAVGRPSTYKPEYARMAEAHCRLGAIDTDLASLFGVSTWSISAWATRYPDFNDALKTGKSAWDSRVEQSLAARAIGYSVDTEEIKMTKDGAVVRVPVRKHYPPDVTACIFWLKNRKPEDWRDVQDYRHSGKVGYENLTAAELLEQIRQDAADLGIMPQTVQELAKGVVKTNGSGANGKTRH